MDDNEEQSMNRLLQPEDMRETLLALRILSPSLLRLKTFTMYRALCKAALKDEHLTIIISSIDAQIAGLVICVRDRRVYLSRFFLHHPIAVVQLICSQILHFVSLRRHGKSQRNQVDLERDIPAAQADQLWSDSSPAIAKILYIGVLMRFRGRGLGGELYRSLFEILTLNGVKRVDARISNGNYASVQMHRKSGWRISELDDGFFATIEISSCKEKGHNA